MGAWTLLIAVAFLAATIAVGAAVAIARKLRFLDRPGSEAHKLHARAIPYGGGIAMAGVLAASLAAVWLPLDADTLAHGMQVRGDVLPGIVLGALAMFALGLFDDFRPLRGGLKFIIQAIVCAGVVVMGDIGIDSLRHIPALSYGLAWAWLVLVTNAYNLLDHADGLSASVALISACVLLSGSLLGEDVPLALLWMAMIGTLGGFLVWNLPPARIYMGDAGALPIGFLIGSGTLSVTFWPSGEGGSPLAVLSPLLITAIPLFDTAVVVVKRLRRGKPVMLGDRNHISHRLGRLGMSSRASLATVAALQTALAAGALQLRQQELMPGLVVLAQSAGILLAVILLETSRDDG